SNLHYDVFKTESMHLNLWYGSVNTVFLLLSSWFVALAVSFSEAGKATRSGLFLFLAGILGIAFLTIKGIEYAHHYAESLVPGIRYENPRDPAAQLFYVLYFFMTGLHAIHLVIGVGLLFWVGTRA